MLLAADRAIRVFARYADPATAGYAWRTPGENLALGKAATQSSISTRWSIGETTWGDAGRANNGVIDGFQGCHTDAEAFPWWQVDLGAICRLHEVRLYNRKDWAQRLRRFSVLVSLDGVRWVELFRKADEIVFGDKKPIPFVVALPADSVGRFVRIQKHGGDYLHFNECQVFGEPVSDLDAPALTAQFTGLLESRVSGALSDRPIPTDPEEASLELFVTQSLFPFPAYEIARTPHRRWILQGVPKGGVGAEVGVFRGHFSQVLLEELAPRQLYLIDPWEKAGKFFYWSDAYTNEGRLPTALARREAALRAAQFPNCSTTLIEDFFPACIGQIQAPLDWIYIDSTHGYEQTLLELRESSKILKPGGLILGDDYYPDPTSAHYGVFRAVNEFLAESDFEIVAAGPSQQWRLRAPEHRRQSHSPFELTAAFRKLFPAGRDYRSDSNPDFLRDIGQVHAAAGDLGEAARLLEMAAEMRRNAQNILHLLDQVRAAEASRNPALNGGSS
jgi:hypothetical protein